jgi:hypothetical protein
MAFGQPSEDKMKLVNLQRYTPDEYFLGEGIQYFKDETGKDWFKSLPEFTKKFSLAIENDTGVIRSINEDASRIYPAGLSVVDVDSLPDGCNIIGGWVFNGKKVIPRTYTPAEYQAQAQEQKEKLIAEASAKTQAWQTQLMLGMITEGDKKSLIAWMEYVQKVQAIDVGLAPDIVFPDQPV